MQPLPAPEHWDAPIQDTAVDTHRGTDGKWHLGASAPGSHPYVTTACGADLEVHDSNAYRMPEEVCDWAHALSLADCLNCKRTGWWAIALQDELDWADGELTLARPIADVRDSMRRMPEAETGGWA